MLRVYQRTLTYAHAVALRVCPASECTRRTRYLPRVSLSEVLTAVEEVLMIFDALLARYAPLEVRFWTSTFTAAPVWAGLMVPVTENLIRFRAVVGSLRVRYACGLTATAIDDDVFAASPGNRTVKTVRDLTSGAVMK